MLRRPPVLVAIAATGVLATAALWLLANEITAGLQVDASLRNDLYAHTPVSLLEPLRGVRSLADPLPFAVGAVALCALAWLRRGAPLAAVTAVVLLLTNAAAQGLQFALHGMRHVEPGAVIDVAGSWPSGHAVAAMTLALGAVLIAGPRLRVLTAIAGLGYAAAVGGALVALGGHLPSDVLAGYLIAAIGAAVGAAVLARLRLDGRSRLRSELVAPALGGLAAIGVLAVGAAKALATRPSEVATAIDNVPLLLAAVVLASVAIALTAGIALTLRR